MAVEYVKELWPGRGGADDIEKRTRLTHVYEVRTTSAVDDATVAGGTALLPRLGDPHPNYPDAVVVGVVPNQLSEDPTLWHVTIEYSSDLPNRSGTGGSGIALGPGPESMGIDSTGTPVASAAPTDRPVNPLNRPAVWRRHRAEIEEPLEFDANGDAVVNSAGLPYDPPLMTKYRYTVLTVIKNIAGISESTINQYDQTTNDATWKGIAAGKALLLIDSTAFDMETGVPFQQLTVEVWVTKKVWGWQRRVVDQGFYKLTDLGAGATAWDRIRDSKTGLFKTEPTLLDGSGQPLDSGSDPVVTEVQEFFESDFDTFFALLSL